MKQVEYTINTMMDAGFYPSGVKINWADDMPQNSRPIVNSTLDFFLMFRPMSSLVERDVEERFEHVP